MKQPKCHKRKYINRIKKNSKNTRVHCLHPLEDQFDIYFCIRQEGHQNIIPDIF